MSRVTYFSFKAKRCNLLKAQAAETPMHANDRVDAKKAPVVFWRVRISPLTRLADKRSQLGNR